MTCSSGWDSSSSASHGDSTATVADKHAGKVVGEPYRGTPDFRFDEGLEESLIRGRLPRRFMDIRNPPDGQVCTKVLLY